MAKFNVKVTREYMDEPKQSGGGSGMFVVLGVVLFILFLIFLR